MAEEAQVNLAEVAAYQGMKIGQLSDRLHQLELMIMQFSKTANGNQKTFIEELSQLKVDVQALKQPLGNGATQTEAFLPGESVCASGELSAPALV